MVGLTKGQFAHVASQFYMPWMIAPELATTGLSDTAGLGAASADLARARILECFRFRAIQDPSGVSACSGYEVGQGTLGACL